MPGTYISPAELGFYYLNSRYYDPSIGRLINADALISTGQGLLGYNMFAYCNNNPIMFCDCDGNCPHQAVHLGDCHNCLAGLPSDTPIASTQKSKSNKAEDAALLAVAQISPSVVDITVALERYSINNAKLPFRMDKGQFKQLTDEELLILDKNAKIASGFFDGVFIFMDVCIGIDKNKQANAPFNKFVYDISVDLVISGIPAMLPWAGGVIGTCIGYAYPAIGPALGKTAGTLFGMTLSCTFVILYDVLKYNNGLTGRDTFKHMYEG